MSATQIPIKKTCRITENEIDVPCSYCSRRGFDVKTTFACITCKIPLCSPCYTAHKFEMLRKKNRSEEEATALKSPSCIKPASKPTSAEHSYANLQKQENIMTSRYLLTHSTAQPLLSLLNKHGYTFAAKFSGKDKVLKSLFIQNEHMTKAFHFYPNFVSLTKIGEVWDLELCFIHVENSNGCHEIIAIILYSAEDPQNFATGLSCFKQKNPDWERIAFIFLDPLILHRDVLQIHFNKAKLLMSAYHLTKLLNSIEEGCASFNYREKSHLILTLGKIKLACTEQEMQTLHSLFLEKFTGCRKEPVWEFIKLLWNEKIVNDINFLASNNKFLRYLHKKVKPALCKVIDFCDFFEKLNIILKLSKNEINIGCKNLNNVFLPQYAETSARGKIISSLTPYAADFVVKHYNLSDLASQSSTMSEMQMIFNNTKHYNSSCHDCTCPFHSITGLPCWHIFSNRKGNNVEFVEEIDQKSWSFNNFIQFQSELYSNVTLANMISPSSCIDELMSVLFTGTSAASPSYGLSVINKIVTAWKESKEVTLILDDDKVLNMVGDSMSHVSTPSHDSVCESLPIHGAVSEFWAYGKHLLKNESISLIFLTAVICRSKKSCIEWLQFHELLPKGMICPACGSIMTLCIVGSLTDGAIWACQSVKEDKKICNKRCSVRRHTWYEDTNMPLETILKFSYMWIHCYTQWQILNELSISVATYVTWVLKFLKMCKDILAIMGKEVRSDNQDLRLIWKMNHKSDEDIFFSFLKAAASLQHPQSPASIKRFP